ncbi:hypothetical protein niasHT_024603 [Heterodera trifolii]|uniref:Uncharacterized protein n=1 Tax=Heterodera trifolii TaxID=157864 RepID=A0ABD2K7M2_9BILA
MSSSVSSVPFGNCVAPPTKVAHFVEKEIPEILRLCPQALSEHKSPAAVAPQFFFHILPKHLQSPKKAVPSMNQQVHAFRAAKDALLVRVENSAGADLRVLFQGISAQFNIPNDIGLVEWFEENNPGNYGIVEFRAKMHALHLELIGTGNNELLGSATAYLVFIKTLISRNYV